MKEGTKFMVSVNSKKWRQGLILLAALGLFLVCWWASGLVLSNTNQAPYISPTEWMRDYGLENNQMGRAILEVPNGNVLIAGVLPNSSFFAMELNPLGEVLWNQRYTGYTYYPDEDEFLSEVIEFGSNQYLLVGGPSEEESIIICIDDEGNFLWDRIFDGEPSYRLKGAATTPEGGAVLVGTLDNGSSTYYGWIHCINSTGGTLWNRTIDVTFYESLEAVTVCPNDDFMVVGYTNSDPDWGSQYYDIWLLRINSTGIIQWNQTYNYTVGRVARAIEPAHGDGYLIAGYQEMLYDTEQVFAMEVDESGNQRWSALYPSGDSRATDIVVCPTGYLLVGFGNYQIPGWHFDTIIALRIDDAGNLLWNWAHGVNLWFIRSWDRCAAISSQDGGFFIVASTRVEKYIAPFDYTNGWVTLVTRLPDPPTPSVTYAQLAFNGILWGIVGLTIVNAVIMLYEIWKRYGPAMTAQFDLKMVAVTIALNVSLLSYYLFIGSQSSIVLPYSTGIFFRYPFPVHLGNYVDFSRVFRLLVSPVFGLSILLAIGGFIILQIGTVHVAEAVKTKYPTGSKYLPWVPLFFFVSFAWVAFVISSTTSIHYSYGSYTWFTVPFLPMVLACMFVGMLPSVFYLHLRNREIRQLV